MDTNNESKHTWLENRTVWSLEIDSIIEDPRLIERSNGDYTYLKLLQNEKIAALDVIFQLDRTDIDADSDAARLAWQYSKDALQGYEIEKGYGTSYPLEQTGP